MMLETIILGIGLSMDCIAVTLSLHAIDRRRQSLIHYILPVGFGIGHTAMPILGWILGMGLNSLISQYDHWISFILLFALGLRMVYTSLQPKSTSELKTLTSPLSLLMLVFATSIDSTVVGMTFAFLDKPIVTTSLIIGTVTLILSLSADLIGDHMGKVFESKKQGALGGLVIMGIGIKILFDHLFF